MTDTDSAEFYDPTAPTEEAPEDEGPATGDPEPAQAGGETDGEAEAASGVEP